MFQYKIEVKNVELSRHEPAHVYLADCLLQQFLATNLNLNEINNVMLNNQDEYYIYLVNTLENYWFLSISSILEPENSKCYRYRGVIKITLPDLLYLCHHQEERLQMLSKLLPVVVNTETDYSNSIRESRRLDN